MVEKWVSEMLAVKGVISPPRRDWAKFRPTSIHDSTTMANFLALGSLLGIWRDRPAIDLPPVETQDLETSTDKRLRKLRHCVRANHANHAVISSKPLPSGNLLGLVRYEINCTASSNLSAADIMLLFGRDAGEARRGVRTACRQRGEMARVARRDYGRLASFPGETRISTGLYRLFRRPVRQLLVRLDGHDQALSL